MIKNTDKFREAVLTFEKLGKYTSAPPRTTAYRDFWDTEMDRCLEGFTADDGDYISGYFYFYLNYCPIQLVIEKEVKLQDGSKRIIGVRELGFPRFWDSDFMYFNAIDRAEKTSQHLVVLKTRGRGYSYKAAAMLCRNYFLIDGSKSYAVAAENEFLVKDGLLTKTWDMMSFVDEHTAWSKKRQKVDTKMHKRASIVVDKDGVKTEIGYLSEIIGITVKNDVQKIRGKRGKLILFEEGGKFPNLLSAWNIARSSMEQGGLVYGTMIAFGTGGCLTAGNKVWNKRGNLVNIEHLKQEDGILGFSTNGVSKETISWMQPTSEKECINIKTNTGRNIECSWDHPILTAKQTRITRGNIIGNSFVKANDIIIGNKIAVIDKVDIFNEEEEPISRMGGYPRVIGWLIGDGTYGDRQSVRLANCEPEIHKYVISNIDYKINVERNTKCDKIYREYCFRNGWRQRLRDLGIYAQTKLRKKLPSNIHMYNKETLAEFIGGLFDADGYVNIRKNKKRNTYIAEISISQSSVNLLEEIRLLLQKFGIHGRIRVRQPRENNPKDKNPWYEFTIADSISLVRFAENIKLYPKVKNDRLLKIKEVFSTIKPHKKYDGYRYEEVISIEEVGIKTVYNLTADVTNTYLANGIITHNTEEGDYEGLKELFYNPMGYNALPFKNIWDEGAVKECGFFVPEYMNLEGYMDDDGNSIIEQAKKYAFEQRQKVEEHANDKESVDRYIAEKPMNPMEATLQLSGNIFPKKDLMRHLNNILTSPKLFNYKQVGELYWTDDARVKWEPDAKLRDITKFPLDRTDAKEGAVVIWEHPPDEIPYGLYVAGCDPYDHDTSTTDSLGSVFVYKRFQNFESYHDIIVAEYTGRPETANEFYENVRKLSVYFRATILYENQNKGLFQYFTTKGCDYLLADQPDIINDIIKDSTVQRKKGIHMNTSIKEWAERETRDWLNEEYAEGKKNLHKIMSIPLLQELISYNDKGNFDRAIALFMIMIYIKELHKVNVSKKRERYRLDTFFTSPMFQDYDDYNLYIN